MHNADELGPLNKPVYATPLDEEVFIGDLCIPPYFAVDRKLYERLRVQNRVENLTDQEWRETVCGAVDECEEPRANQQKTSRRKKNAVYQEVLGLQLTDSRKDENKVATFSPEQIAAIPLRHRKGLTVFPGLRGEWFGRHCRSCSDKTTRASSAKIKGSPLTKPSQRNLRYHGKCDAAPGKSTYSHDPSVVKEFLAKTLEALLTSPYIPEPGKAQLRLTINSVQEPKRNFARDASETPTSFKDVAEQVTAELDAMTVPKHLEFGDVDSQSED
jgi:hypothetical protein